jgi:hypothetical protein
MHLLAVGPGCRARLGAPLHCGTIRTGTGRRRCAEAHPIYASARRWSPAVARALARRCIAARSEPLRIAVGALKRTLCICSRLAPIRRARLGAPLHRGTIRTAANRRRCAEAHPMHLLAVGPGTHRQPAMDGGLSDMAPSPPPSRGTARAGSKARMFEHMDVRVRAGPALAAAASGTARSGMDRAAAVQGLGMGDSADSICPRTRFAPTSPGALLVKPPARATAEGRPENAVALDLHFKRDDPNDPAAGRPETAPDLDGVFRVGPRPSIRKMTRSKGPNTWNPIPGFAADQDAVSATLIAAVAGCARSHRRNPVLRRDEPDWGSGQRPARNCS